MTELPRVQQVTHDELTALMKAKKYKEVDRLAKAGAMNAVMGAEAPIDFEAIDGQWTQEALTAAHAAKAYAVITAAHESGKLDQLLQGSATDAESETGEE